MIQKDNKENGEDGRVGGCLGHLLLGLNKATVTGNKLPPEITLKSKNQGHKEKTTSKGEEGQTHDQGPE